MSGLTERRFSDAPAHPPRPQNAVTRQPFWWALVDTVGGTFDVVIDPALLSNPIRPGNVIAGWFWLSGRFAPASRHALDGCKG